MKRTLSILLTAAMVITCLTGVSTTARAEAAPEKALAGTEITVLCEGHASSNAYEKLLPEFEEATGIKVNLEIIPYEELPQKVLLSFSQKSTDYDMIMNDSMFLQGYIANDYIAPIDEFIADDTLNMYYDKADFVESYEKTMEYDGVTYGFPVYGESTFLMYRKDLFEKYGLEVPKTLTEMEECAKTIYEGEGGEVAGITLRGQQGVHVVYVYGAYLWGYGGHYFNEEGKLDIATDEAVAGTEAFVRILNSYGPAGFTNFGWQENRLLFQQGKAGMTIDATVNGAYCEDPSGSEIVGLVGYAPVPCEVENEEGGNASLSVHGFYINNAIEENQKKAAFLFGSWATNAATQEESIAVEAHCGLTSKTAMYSDAFQEQYGAFANDMIEALASGNPLYMPTITEANEVINRVGTALSSCLVDGSDIRQTLQDVCDDVNTNVLK